MLGWQLPAISHPQLFPHGNLQPYSQVNYAGLSGAENDVATDTDASDIAKDTTDSADTDSTNTDSADTDSTNTDSADADATDRAIEMAIKNSEPQKWPYTKFMLIGDGRAGKTAVANSISGKGKLAHNQAAALPLTLKTSPQPKSPRKPLTIP